jgi:hypothetical protein
MTRLEWLIAALVAETVVLGVTCGPTHSQTMGQPPIASRPSSLETMAGVYRHRFANGDVTGRTFQSEDILEIVPVAPSAAYFRLHMEFYNGHMCNIWGVARQQAQTLVYNGQSDCRLTLARGPDGVRIYEADNLACKMQTCGERGGYGAGPAKQVDFKAAERQPIRYMKTLLASRQYKAAMAEYDGQRPGGDVKAASPPSPGS